MIKKLMIVGSTGSIGLQTLNIVRQYPQEFQVVGLCALGNNIETLAQQAIEFDAKIVGIYDENKRQELSNQLKNHPAKLVCGLQSLTCVAQSDADIIVVALSGMIALHTVVAGIHAKKTIALANKECLVAGGSFIMPMAKDYGVTIRPIDSEHAALQQCIQDSPQKISRLILTASGGPFYQYTQQQLQTVTKSQALQHPTWNMGNKITIDSATMMNKALEIIEASHLFSGTTIDYCIHPQSIIHSMVEYIDGSILAQLSNPSMHLPIMLAISDKRLDTNTKKLTQRLNFETLQKLTFETKNESVFPAPQLAQQILTSQQSKPSLTPCIFNTANEVAVQLFLQDKIAFTDIVDIVQKAINTIDGNATPTMDSVFECDKQVRQKILSQYA